MSQEKTAWVELQVTMSQELRATIHECCRVLGCSASGWARNLLLNEVPALVSRAEEREAAIQALSTRGVSTGSRKPGPVRKTPHAVATKAGKAKPARSSKA